MNVRELMPHIEARALTGETGLDNPVSAGYACDLLSWVMAHGREHMAWVTVQTHMNVIAVATLLDMACVILPENIAIEQATLDKAIEEEIPVLGSGKTSYELAGLLYAQGVPNPVK